MAIRKVLKYGDPFLRQKTKEVLKVSKKIQVLISDMIDTMYVENGVGLAAPQVGEALRICVIDPSPSNEPAQPIVFINPKLIKKSGAISSRESCLSFPNAFTEVRRYENVLFKAFDRNGKPFTMEGKDGSLLAIVMQHEFDHLNGVLFIDHARNRFDADKALQENNLPPIEADMLLEEEEMEQIINSKEKEEKEQKGKENS